jgi:hypothetical protein
MCSVLEPGRTEWNGSIPRAWNGSDPVFGSEKFEERNGSILVLGFVRFLENGMGQNEVVRWHAATPHAGTLPRSMPPPA